MVALVEHIERDIAPIEVAVFNIGANVRFGITETTARVYQKVWEMACFSGFLMGRETAKAMLPRGRGTIIFTGATAACAGARLRRLRRRQARAARAGAEHGARAWPKNIHVAHPVIDGAIDTEWIRNNFPEIYAEGAAGHPDPDTSPRPTGRSTASRATPGRTRPNCGRGSRAGRRAIRSADLRPT